MLMFLEKNIFYFKDFEMLSKYFYYMSNVPWEILKKRNIKENIRTRDFSFTDLTVNKKEKNKQNIPMKQNTLWINKQQFPTWRCEMINIIVL